MRMTFDRKLPIPQDTKTAIPIDEETKMTVSIKVNDIMDILDNVDNRFLLIIGPCSADDETTVISYIMKLKTIQEQVKNKILIVPRVYTEKPRSDLNEYKGLVHQPDPTSSPDLFEGIVATRRIHMKVVKETGFVAADEMLYTENYKYIDDLLGYCAIGARSAEDQQHILTASAAECPVGIKNPMNGNLEALTKAVKNAQEPHDFIYRGWAGYSHGNSYAHAILRGYTTRKGKMKSNYNYGDVLELKELFSKYNIKNPAVIIDCNHANSCKDPFEQIRIAQTVAQYRELNSIGDFVKGIMVESYIYDGRQDISDGNYILGKSITDACLGWEKTMELINSIYEIL